MAYLKNFCALCFYCIVELIRARRLGLIVSFFIDYIKIRKLIKFDLGELLKRYKGNNFSLDCKKYSDINYWVLECLIRVYRLKLQNKKIRILDLGSGTGYFSYICKYFGNYCTGLDTGSNEMYNKFCDALKIDRFNSKIIKYCKLKISGKYDLITAFMVCFNNHKKNNLWGVDEWSFFLSDLKKNYLNKHGVIYLELNPESTTDPIDRILLKHFITNGAIVNGLKITIPSANYNFRL